MKQPVTECDLGPAGQVPADREAGSVGQAEVPPVEVGGVVQIDQQAPAADKEPGIGGEKGGELPEGEPGGQHPAPGGVEAHLVLEVLRPQDIPQAQADGLPPRAQLHILLPGREQPVQLAEEPLQIRRLTGLYQILHRLDPVALQGVVRRGGGIFTMHTSSTSSEIFL